MVIIMGSKKGLSRIEETRHYGSDGTQVVDIKTSAVLVEGEPPFVKLYLDDIVMLSDLPKSCSDVLFTLIQNSMTYGNKLLINNHVKKEIQSQLGYKTTQSVANAITKFVKADILKRIDIGTYQLNPNLFAKGYWVDIQKLRAEWLELKIRYDSNGKRHLSASCEYQEKATY
jgi:hypothetical protein